MFFKKKNDNDLLSNAIDVLMKQDTTENRKQVFAAFRRYVEEGKWLFSLGEMDGNGGVLYFKYSRQTQ